MTDARRDQWNERLRQLSAIEAACVARMDYRRADDAIAARRRAQQLWSREVFRASPVRPAMPFVDIVMSGGRPALAVSFGARG